MLLFKYQLIGFLTIFFSISGCRSKSERTVELSDGSYSGKISKDGKKEGSGIYRWKDGSTYEGNYLEGKRHGHGKFLWANGESYKGEYHHDERTGFGEYLWPDGSRYSGQFLKGKRHGKGIFTSPDSVVYDGEWFDDLQHGEGTLVYPDGRMISGIWRLGNLMANPNRIPSNSLKPSLPFIQTPNLTSNLLPSSEPKLTPKPAKETNLVASPKPYQPSKTSVSTNSPVSKNYKPESQIPAQNSSSQIVRTLSDIPEGEKVQSETNILQNEDIPVPEESENNQEIIPDWSGTVAEAELIFNTELFNGLDTVRYRSNGLPFTGRMRILNARGQMEGEVDLLNGHLHGEEIFYDASGNVKERNFWSRGKPTRN
jgi:hypothetical protein